MQFGIFGGIALILFGWIEKKDRFTDIGRFVFMALGIYALWILLSGQVQAPQTISDIVSKEVRAIAFFKGIVICAGICIVSFLLKIFNSRYYRFVTLICVVFALFLFFTVYNLQQGN